MPRLTIEQVRAPDLSGTSRILANAGQAFDKGIASAQGLLGSYQEGQQTIADNSIVNDLDRLRTEEDVDRFLNSGALDGLNLSPAMRERIAGLRGNRVGLAGDRASTNARNATTAIAQAAENRTASGFADDIARRDTLRSNAGIGTAAIIEGREFGTSRQQGEFDRRGNHVFGNADAGTGPVNGNTGPIQATDQTVLDLARTLQAEAGQEGLQGMLDVGAVIRNRATSGKYGNGIDGVIKKPGQFSAWNSETGYAGGEQGQNMNFTPNAEALRAAQSIISGQYNDNTGGATHYYNPDISQPSWGGNIRNPAASAQQESLVASGQFSAAEIEQLLSGTRAAQASGDARIAGETQTAIDERSAQAILDASNAAGNQNIQDVSTFANTQNTGLTATEQLNQQNNVVGSLSAGTALGDALSGTGTGTSSEVKAASEGATANIDAALQRDQVVQAYQGAQTYQNGGDIAEQLVVDLTRMGAAGMVPSDIRGEINSMARDLGISDAEAAYAFKLAAEDDQNFLVGADGWLTFFADGLSQNKATALAERLYKGENSASTRRRISDANQSKQEISRLQTAANRAANILQKATERGGTPSDRVVENAEKARAALLEAVQGATLTPTNTGPSAASFLNPNQPPVARVTGSAADRQLQAATIDRYITQNQ